MRFRNQPTLYFLLLTNYLLIIDKDVHSQSYQMQYQCEFANLGRIEILASDTLKGENQINKLIPVTISLTYEITYSDGYMEVTGFINNNNSLFEIEEKSAHIFFDLKRNLAYFPEEHVVKRMILYDLIPKDSNNNKCKDFYIKGFDSTYYVSTNDSLPRFALPAVNFIKNKSGITKIVTPTFIINLVKFNMLDKKPDFQAMIHKFSELEVTGEYRFIK